MRKAVVIASLGILLYGASCPRISAQGNLGMDPASSFHRFGIDTVNLENGNVVIHIPLVSYPQRDGRTISYSFNTNTSIWVDDFACSGLTCDHQYDLAWNPGQGDVVALPPPPGIYRDQAIDLEAATLPYTYCYPFGGGGAGDVTEEFCNNAYLESIVLQDSVGTQHNLVQEQGVPYTLRTTDGSGYLVTTDQPNPFATSARFNVLSIQGPDGKDVSLNAKDENGNPYYSLVTNSDGSRTFHDSVGRAIPESPPSSLNSSTAGCPNLGLPLQQLVGSYTWTVPGPNGTQQSYLLCYAKINYWTNFWDYKGQELFYADMLCTIYPIYGSGSDLVEEGNYLSNYGLTPMPVGLFETQFGGDNQGGEDCSSYMHLESTGYDVFLQSLVLPDGTAYKFQYDASDPNDPNSYGHYGNISRITFPTGGSVSYEYAENQILNFDGDPSGYGYLQTVTLRTEDDGQGHTYQWKYSYDQTSPYHPTTKETDPNGNDTLYIWATPPNTLPYLTSPLVESERKVYSGPQSNNQLLRDVVSNYNWTLNPTGDSVAYFQPPYSIGNVLMTSRSTTIPNTVSGGSTITGESFYYDPTVTTTVSASGMTSNTQLSLGIPYYHSISGPGVSTYTVNQFSWWTQGSATRHANLLAYPTSSTVWDGQGNTASQATFSYDESSYSQAGPLMGKVTTISKWNSYGAPITTHTYWDQQRLISKQTDGNGNPATSYTYLPISDSSYPIPGYGIELYPTKITDAAGFSDSYTYDFNTGAVTSLTDPNQKTTTVAYDNMGRPWYTIRPDISAGSGASIVACYPNATTLETFTAQAAAVAIPASSTQCPTASGNTIAKTQIYDGLGRPVTSLVAQGNGTSIESDTVYDGLDHVTSTTNPYVGTPGGSTGYTYDGLGRVLVTTHYPDASFTQNTYDGLNTIFTDEVNHTWTRSFDAVGRLVQVVEPGSLNTSYQYDVLGNLKCVDQWGTSTAGTSCTSSHARQFTYDSLSRLIQAFNPESGWTCYGTTGGANPNGSNCTSGYDANGNLLAKTDARGVTVKYAYDNLNRLYQKTYSTSSGSTTDPVACMQYDSPGSNAIGRLAMDWTQAAGSSCPGPISSLQQPPSGSIASHVISGYDAMGRLKSEQQDPYSAGGVNYSLLYDYDLAGNVTCENNGFANATSSDCLTNFTPSTSSIQEQFSYDAVGHLAGGTTSVLPATFTPATSYPATLLQANSTNPSAYDPTGHLVNAQFGVSSSGAAVQINRQYDSRGRITSESDMGTNIPGATTVQITGTEQTATTTGNPMVALTVIGAEQVNSSGTYDFGYLQPVFGSSAGSCAPTTPNYGQNSTATSMAASLAGVINSSCSSLLSATVSTTNANVVLVTSKLAASAGGNFSVGVAGMSLAGFSPASFQFMPSATTMTVNPTASFTFSWPTNAPTAFLIFTGTEGQSGSTWDTGTLTGSVKNSSGSVLCNFSSSYQQNSTVGTIVTSLVSSINSGGCASFVNASGSAYMYDNSYLEVTANAVGTNYSVNLAISSNDGFSPSSFSVSPSTTAMVADQVPFTSGVEGMIFGGPNTGGAEWASLASNSTPSSMASNLAAQLNSCCSSSFSAVASGPSVLLTSTAPSINYSISTGYNGMLPYVPFVMTTSGPTTVGSNVTVADSGTVALSVKGTQIASALYNQNSSPASIASALASSSSGNGIATVTANGANLTIAALSDGSSSNYSYSFSATSSIPSYFARASFNATPASGSLAGGRSTQIYSWAGSYATNNNLLSYSDSVTGSWSMANGYDSLNRLTAAQNTGTTSTSTQFANMYGCWTYDAFGNRTSEAMSTTPCTSSPPLASWATYNTTNNNRMDTTSLNANQSNGYDTAGNVINDGRNKYLYDAEGRLCAIYNALASTATQYVYDAEGQRVAKGALSSWPTACTTPTSTNGFTATNIYLLGQGGQQVTELSVSGNTATPLHTNIFVGGTLLATYDFPNGGVHFALTDPLGTRRVEANGIGTAELNCLSLPFGNNLGNTYSTNCVPVLSGATDATEHHFTGKERDSESGNDYFGARYYSSAMGRFLSPDWSLNPQAVPYADLQNPQSLNLYSYVGNNPLSRADADGHVWQELMNFIFDRTHQWKNDEEMVDYRRGILRLQTQSGFQSLEQNKANVAWVNSLSADQVNFYYKYITDEDFRGQIDAIIKPAVQIAVTFGPEQLQKKFKHAGDFGVKGNYNVANRDEFQKAMEDHMADPNTQVYDGTYRKQPVDIYYNSVTNNAILVDKSGNYISGWKLSADQVANLMRSGNIQ